MAAMNNNSSVAAAPATTTTAALKSPRHTGDGVSSPQSRRPSRAGASPWNPIVRREEPIATVPSSPSSVVAEQAIIAAGGGSGGPSSSSSSPPPSASSSPSLVEETGVESSESGSGPNGNVGKRSAWNKPSNGAAEVGLVMGASWPALSESTRASPKSSSESLKGLSDGLSSVSISQGSGTAMPTATPSQKHAHPTSTPNHATTTRQRSMKRNNSNVSSNGGISQQQTPASQVVEVASSNPSPREHTQRSGFGSHSDGGGGGDHPQHRNSFRNRNGGPHPRGDGSHHHNNYGGRRDQDRGNHDWNNRRSFNGRDSHMQQRVVPRVYRGTTPPPSPTFIPPHAIRSYGTPPMGFPGELGHPFLYVAPPPPFVAPMHPMFMPASPDTLLPSKIVNQIDYYFSNENLIKDTFLRQKMDDQGWVHIRLIAGFKKVSLEYLGGFYLLSYQAALLCYILFMILSFYFHIKYLVFYVQWMLQFFIWAFLLL